MPDVNNGIALGVIPPGGTDQKIQYPDIGKTLSTFAQLQMSGAHAGLYSLQAARQAMLINALQGGQDGLPNRLAGAGYPEMAKQYVDFNKSQAEFGANQKFAADPSHNPDDLSINPALRSTVQEANANVGLRGAQTQQATAETQKINADTQQKNMAIGGQIAQGYLTAPTGPDGNPVQPWPPPGQENALWGRFVGDLKAHTNIPPQAADQILSMGWNPDVLQRFRTSGQTVPESMVSSGQQTQNQGIATNNATQNALDRHLELQKSWQNKTGTMSAAIPYLQETNRLSELGSGTAKNQITAESQAAGLPQEAERQRLAAETQATQERLALGQPGATEAQKLAAETQATKDRLAAGLPKEGARQDAAGKNEGNLPYAFDLALRQSLGTSTGQIPADATKKALDFTTSILQKQGGTPLTDAGWGSIAASVYGATAGKMGLQTPAPATPPAAQSTVLSAIAKDAGPITNQDNRTGMVNARLENAFRAQQISSEAFNKYYGHGTDTDLKAMSAEGAMPGPQHVMTPAETLMNNDLTKAGAANYVDSTKTYGKSIGLMQRLDVMDHDMESLGPSWMGAGAPTKYAFANNWNGGLDKMGITKFAHFDPSKISTYQELTKETTRTGFEFVQSQFGNQREAMQTIQTGVSAVPSVQNTPLGFKYMSATIRSAAQEMLDMHEFKTRIISGGDEPPSPGSVRNAAGDWVIPDPQNPGKTFTVGKNLVGADIAFAHTHPPEDYARAGIANGAIAADPQGAQHIKLLLNNPTPANIKLFDKTYGDGMGEFIAHSDAAKPLRMRANPAP